MLYFNDSMWFLLTLDSCIALVDSSISAKHSSENRCDPDIRNDFSVREAYAVHKSAGEDDLPVANAGENLSCTEISVVFHVKSFVLLELEFRAWHWKISKTLRDLSKRNFEFSSICIIYIRMLRSEPVGHCAAYRKFLRSLLQRACRGCWMFTFSRVPSSNRRS